MTVMCSKVGYIRGSDHILGSKLMLGHACSTFVQAPEFFIQMKARRKHEESFSRN